MLDKMPDLTQPQYAPLWGALMTFLRAWYKGKRWKARMLEGLMMGVALLGAVPLFLHMGFDTNYAIAFAGWAGYVGVDALAELFSRQMAKEGIHVDIKKDSQ